MSPENHRFGYNGKEKDPALGDLTKYDYGFRIYNPGLGRFLGVDPLAYSFTSWSPYNYTLNNPISYIDPDGKSPVNALQQGPGDPPSWWQRIKNFFGFGDNTFMGRSGNEDQDRVYRQRRSDAINTINEVHEALKPVRQAGEIAADFIPGGSFLDGDVSAGDVGIELAGLIPGVKFAKFGGKQVVKFSDEIVSFIQKTGVGDEAVKIITNLPEGFSRVKGARSHGQKVYGNGKTFISPDVDGHKSGSVWKAAKKIEDLGDNTKRLGTFDKELNRIGN